MKTKVSQRRLSITVLVVLAILCMSQLASAAWPTDPTVNLPICTEAGNQEAVQIIDDGTGGTITAWADARSGNYDIYAQRVDANGSALWTANGVAICTAFGNQGSYKGWQDVQIISDGAGGAIITWADGRNPSSNFDIYAQRVNADGSPLWTANGVAICTARLRQLRQKCVSDGAGGAIITWHHHNGGSGSWDVYVQRVDADGNVLWRANGVKLFYHARTPSIVSDGAGGAIVAWWNSGVYSVKGINVQRVNASGSILWAPRGVPIPNTSMGWDPMLVSDGANGAILTWPDQRSGNWDIYAQRVDANGNVRWAANCVPICTASGNQFWQQLVSDGADGAIITWGDERIGGNFDIYAQRVDSNGGVLWTADGVPVCTASGMQAIPILVSDDANGAILTWHDERAGGNYDIYAQRVDSSGGVLWTADGVPVSTAPENQQYPKLVSDGASGAIVAWQDYRSGTNWDIYAQRVYSDGSLEPVDTTPPEISVSVKPTELWPPNHKMKAITATVTVTDNLDPSPTVVLTSIVSDEPDEGLGDGDKPNDIQDADIGEEDYEFSLRAERSGGGDGRIYTITYTATDVSGNSQSALATVTVPHDKGKGKAAPGLLTFKALSAYPQPCNPEAWIPYTLAKDVDVTITIYNSSGRMIRTLQLGNQNAGAYISRGKAAYWDGKNNTGETVSSGVYFYRLKAGDFTAIKKLVVLR